MWSSGLVVVAAVAAFLCSLLEQLASFFLLQIPHGHAPESSWVSSPVSSWDAVLDWRALQSFLWCGRVVLVASSSYLVSPFLLLAVPSMPCVIVVDVR